VQFGRHDPLVPVGQVLRALFQWKTIAPDRVFFHDLSHEGHLVRTGRSRASSLAAMAMFIQHVLGDKKRKSREF